MLSNVIIDQLDGQGGGLGLTKGTNLFAEQARGDQHVLVSVTTHGGEEYIAAVRYASVNVRVVGWPIKDGYALAEQVANAIAALEGGQYQFVNGSSTETYDIASVTVRNWPTLFTTTDKVGYTLNFDFAYKLAIA